MKVELPLKTPITIFVRVKGERGEREFQAILSTGSTPAVISKIDAMQLGYDIIQDLTEEEEAINAVTSSGTIEGLEIPLKEVRLGDLVAKDVQAVVLDMPTVGGVDMLLGTSFLKNFKTTLDYDKEILVVEGLERSGSEELATE